MVSKRQPSSSSAEDFNLYPTVALSDVANAVGHAYGAYLCWNADRTASLGLLFVSAAAVAGVLRFGLHSRAFQPWNQALAEIAGFVGLPLVGHRCLTRLLNDPAVSRLVARTAPYPAVADAARLVWSDPLIFACCLFVLASGIREAFRWNEGLRSLWRTVIAFTLFVIPTVAVGVFTGGDAAVALPGSVGLFLAAALVVGADRHRCILGMRRENWFHYLIAAAAVGIGHGLTLV